MAKSIDLTGQRYGRLVVLKLYEVRDNPCGHKYKVWLCKCDCGTIKPVIQGCLRNSETKSCGCLQKELLSERQKTHGKTNTSLYKAWCNMKSRCETKNRADFNDYGGRGIKVCPEWEVYLNFEKWALENGYNEEKINGKNVLSLDRIDVNGDYCPDNCRWATYSQQANNKRNTRRFCYSGKNMTAREWAIETGIPYRTLVGRLHNPKWTIERALTQPVKSIRGRKTN